MSLRHKPWYVGCIAVAASFGVINGAQAQRANENVVTSAEDAFGTRVGNDSVGLYDSRSARGFDPQQAGNMRIEGLYFDQQALVGPRLSKSTTMRIGLSAQSYPFPAPTGIADISLVSPTKQSVLTVATQFQTPSGMRSVTADLATPLIADKLGLAMGVNVFQQWSDWRGKGNAITSAGVFRWTPNDSVEVTPFLYYSKNFNAEVQPFMLPGGAYLPPRINRDVFFGQYWALRSAGDLNTGVLMRTTQWDNWRLQAGLFRSAEDRPHNAVIFYRNIQPDGTANLDITGYPLHKSASNSGEVRASGVFTDGSFRHTIHLAVRGRDTERLFGGGDTESFGLAKIGVYQAFPEPTFHFGLRDKDVVRQITPGVSYAGRWANNAEFSLGLQKSFYHRNFGKLGLTPVTTQSEPWLYNGTLAVYPTTDLAVYAGYTRGLEEFGTAPDNAANAGEPLPASITEQVDAGLRYRIIPGLNMMVGVFQVTKPYFDLTPSKLYTAVGNLRHRGIEMSLSGQPVKGVTVIAGAVFLQPRASGLTVDQGLIGRVPPGTSPRTVRINVQYDIPGVAGLSTDVQLDMLGSLYANRTDTLRVPSSTTVALGTRYAFTAYGTKANLRLQLQNITDAYAWTVDGASGRLAPSAARRFMARLAADF